MDISIQERQQIKVMLFERMCWRRKIPGGSTEIKTNHPTLPRDSAIDVMKGIAICMVILVHSRQMFKGLSPVFDFLRFGQMGCQIFFVISGYLAEKSMSRNPDSKSFWKKRYMSIAPAYYVMLIIWLMASHILEHFGYDLGFMKNRRPMPIVCNVLFLNGLLESCNNDVMPGSWYIGTTMIFYCIAPLMHRVMSENKWSKALLMISFIVSISIPFLIWYITADENVIKNNEFIYFHAITQMPCFLLGMKLYIQEKGEEGTGEKVNLLKAAIFLVITIILFFVDIFSYRYIIMVSTMGIASYYLLCYCLEKHISNKILEKFGRMSFYMFLTHPFFVWTMPVYVIRLLKIQGTFVVSAVYIVMLPIMFVGTYLTGRVLEKFVKS